MPNANAQPADLARQCADNTGAAIKFSLGLLGAERKWKNKAIAVTYIAPIRHIPTNKANHEWKCEKRDLLEVERTST